MDACAHDNYDFLPYLMPNLLIVVVASEKGAEVLIQDGDGRYEVSLKGRVWRLFDLLVNAQLAAKGESSHLGFRSTDFLRRALVDRPLHDYAGEYPSSSRRRLSAEDVAKRINLLRDKLAEARYGKEGRHDPWVEQFRMKIVEKTGAGYRLSVPPENIVRVNPENHGSP